MSAASERGAPQATTAVPVGSAAGPLPSILPPVLGSILHWLGAGFFFFTFCPLLIFIALFIDPRENDRPVRMLARLVVRLAGAHVELRCAPGFDPQRTGFMVSNHVNLFDPFVLYSVVPQFIRGLELESHFKIPVYGLLMKRFGNVPVPDVHTPSAIKRMWKLTRQSLDRGVSLVVFPEGGRTVTGHVGEFQEGVFRMAPQWGTPITPVSIVGSFEFNRKISWQLRPSRVIVYLHDTIETTGLTKDDAGALCTRVREIVSAPVEAYYQAAAAGDRGIPPEM